MTQYDLFATMGAKTAPQAQNRPIPVILGAYCQRLDRNEEVL